MTAPTLIARAPITSEWATAGSRDLDLLLIRDDVDEARASVLAAHYATPDAVWITPAVTRAELGGPAVAYIAAEPALLVIAPQTAPVAESSTQPTSPGLEQGPLGAPHVPAKQATPRASRDNGTGQAEAAGPAGAANPRHEITGWHASGIGLGLAATAVILAATFVAPQSAIASALNAPTAPVVDHTEWRWVGDVCTDITVLTDGALIPHHVENPSATKANCSSTAKERSDA